MEYSNAANNDIETIRSPYTINENVGRANTRGDIMIINGNGERKRVKLEEYNKSQQIDEDKTRQVYPYLNTTSLGISLMVLQRPVKHLKILRRSNDMVFAAR